MKPKVGVIGTAEKWSSVALSDALASRAGTCPLFSMADVRTDLTRGRVICAGEDLGRYDALVIKKIAETYSPDALDRLEVLRYLEQTGVRVFSPAATLLGLINRLSCTVTLSAAGIAMPETTVTENADAAVDAVAGFGAAVLKPLFSTKARGMAVIDSAETGWKKKVRAFAAENSTIYIQKKVDMPGRDLGVAFLGGRYLATYARVGNSESWNTTIHSGGRYEAVTPDDAIIDLATRAQGLFNLDFTCVDVVETTDGPKVFEVSAFGGFRGLKDAHGIDAAALYADHVMSEMKSHQRRRA